MTYTIYGKDNCPNCTKAENLLKLRGAKFQKLMLDKDYSVSDLTEVAGEPIRMLPFITQSEDGIVTKLGAGDKGIQNLIQSLRV